MGSGDVNFTSHPTPPPSPGRKAALRLADEARDLWRQGKWPEAIEHLELALKKDPKNPEICVGLAKAHASCHRHDCAMDWLKKAFAMAPDSAQLQLESALQLHQFGRIDQAVICLQKTLQLQPGNITAQSLLAEIAEHQHALDKALEHVERVRAFAPQHPGMQLLMGRIFRRQGKWDQAETKLRDLATTHGLPAELAYRGWMELGHVFDAQKQYDDAMAAFQRGKSFLIPKAPQQWALLQTVHDRMAEMLALSNAELFQKWKSALPSLTPGRRISLLCGHPRSGTTLVEQVIDAHPQAISLEETRILHDNAYLPLTRDMAPETSILKVLNDASDQTLRDARAEYWRCAEGFLGESIGDRLLVDKNPAFSILLLPLARFFPEAKILVALRDPRDVVLSCFMQPLSLNPVSSSYLTLEKTVEQYAGVMQFLNRLRPLLPQDTLEVRYERFVSNPEPESRRLLDFLGLPWDPGVMQFHDRAREKWVRSPTYDAVSQPIHQKAVGRWQGYAHYLEPQLPKLKSLMDSMGYS